MKPALILIGKQAIFPQKFQYPSYNFHMTPALILNINKDVI